MARKKRSVQPKAVSATITENPKVVAFICNWQSKNKKKAIDLSSKLFPTDVKLLRVMCASRIDRAMLLKCVQEKVDGIFIGICNSDMCQYRGAIELAERRFENTIDLLDILGYDKKRVHVFEDDGGTVDLLPKALEEFTKKIKQLGLYP